MSDNMIHVPARKREPVSNSQVVRISPEAYNALIKIYNECTLSMKELVSLIILESVDRVVFDKEEQCRDTERV